MENPGFPIAAFEHEHEHEHEFPAITKNFNEPLAENSDGSQLQPKRSGILR